MITKSLGRSKLVEYCSKLGSHDIYTPKLERECYSSAEIKDKKDRMVLVKRKNTTGSLIVNRAGVNSGDPNQLALLRSVCLQASFQLNWNWNYG